jgi:hypothetical protein
VYRKTLTIGRYGWDEKVKQGAISASSGYGDVPSSLYTIMTEIGSLFVSPPIINSSCPWASDLDDLASLYESPFTGAVTTRTATWSGFEEDSAVHRVRLEHVCVFPKKISHSIWARSPFMPNLIRLLTLMAILLYL